MIMNFENKQWIYKISFQGELSIMDIKIQNQPAILNVRFQGQRHPSSQKIISPVIYRNKDNLLDPTRKMN